MKAFLKRRWLLLSCVVVLLACSMMNVECLPLRGLVIKDGAFHLERGITVFWWRRVRVEFHKPDFGELPEMIDRGRITWVIPLWLPLSAILGWIVIRELRWRENRAKASESETAPIP